MDDKGVLSDTDRAILDLEERMPAHSGAKERAIRELTGTGPARYYQRCDNLIELPEVIAERPMLVNRLMRLRAQRTTSRNRRILGR